MATTGAIPPPDICLRSQESPPNPLLVLATVVVKMIFSNKSAGLGRLQCMQRDLDRWYGLAMRHCTQGNEHR